MCHLFQWHNKRALGSRWCIIKESKKGPPPMTKTVEKVHPYATEIRSLMRTLKRHGFAPVSVNDGETYEKVENQSQAVDIILSVDESWLRVKHENGKRATVFIVLGNDPGEAVCDHHDWDPLTVAVSEHYDRWSE